MSARAIGYACVTCYIAAHDSTAPSPHVDPFDIALTDWVCVDHEGDDCTACDGTYVEHGVTVGGQCDLGEHSLDGYWEYYTYSA